MDPSDKLEHNEFWCFTVGAETYAGIDLVHIGSLEKAMIKDQKKPNPEKPVLEPTFLIANIDCFRCKVADKIRGTDEVLICWQIPLPTPLDDQYGGIQVLNGKVITRCVVKRDHRRDSWNMLLLLIVRVGERIELFRKIHESDGLKNVFAALYACLPRRDDNDDIPTVGIRFETHYSHELGL
jgi:hypothetical protein